ncbi:MAG: GNAT family N-acetyltransferase [Proteobacteria bacterium]|nr:GNAT family N-acetyltransferase [Pseudomonadota bacterium]
MVLEGQHVRLEPLTSAHVDALLAAGAGESELFRWTTVPTSPADMRRYIDTALKWQAEGTALPFATVRRSDGRVVGSTRFFLIERWAWPAGHPEHAARRYDGCEVGYTWLNSQAIRTALNTEAKFLMLRHAFEAWRMHRVCFHTDARNERSRNALLRIGAKFEGVLRAHRLSADLAPRDSARYSVIAAEWPVVRERLRARLED